MGTETTDFQDDLQAWFDDEAPGMVNSTVGGINAIEAIKEIPKIIACLPGFVQFMTVQELCDTIDGL